MAATTRIEWADATFNPWVGCTRVSDACDNCYAEGWARRTGQPQLWQGERRRTTETYWQQPLKWNRKAEREGRRLRVFCASLADVFDNQAPEAWRHDLWDLIRWTRHLDWLLLTKRPQNAPRMLPRDPSGGWPWPNVWLGTTVETQTEADRRIPHLLSVPAAVHFLSCEPLLGPVDLTHIETPRRYGTSLLDALDGVMRDHLGGPLDRGLARLSWIIAGGESGPKARPSHPDWFRHLRDQCAAAGVPFFFKQWGEWCHDPGSAHFKEFGPPWQRLDSGKPGVRPAFMRRRGKKLAGRLLDGIEHNGVPESLDA